MILRRLSEAFSLATGKTGTFSPWQERKNIFGELSETQVKKDVFDTIEPEFWIGFILVIKD